MTREEMYAEVLADLKGLSTAFTLPTDIESAITDALRDTGWAFPVTVDYNILWLKKRINRYLFYMLTMESSVKFKFEGINLQQRFEHYSKLVADLDKEWEAEQPGLLFASIGAAAVGGIQIDSGFAYETGTGRDITYDDENSATITPSIPG